MATTNKMSRKDATFYGQLTADEGKRNLCKSAANVIKARLRIAGESLVIAGEKLIEVKETLDHGQWLIWLSHEFDWDDRTAENYMNVARKFKFEKISDLGLGKSVMIMLAAPSVSDEIRTEAIDLARGGEKLTVEKTKQLIAEGKKVESPIQEESEEEQTPKADIRKPDANWWYVFNAEKHAVFGPAFSSPQSAGVWRGRMFADDARGCTIERGSYLLANNEPREWLSRPIRPERGLGLGSATAETKKPVAGKWYIVNLRNKAAFDRGFNTFFDAQHVLDQLANAVRWDCEVQLAQNMLDKNIPKTWMMLPLALDVENEIISHLEEAGNVIVGCDPGVAEGDKSVAAEVPNVKLRYDPAKWDVACPGCQKKKWSDLPHHNWRLIDPVRGIWESEPCGHQLHDALMYKRAVIQKSLPEMEEVEEEVVSDFDDKHEEEILSEVQRFVDGLAEKYKLDGQRILEYVQAALLARVDVGV